MCLEAGESHRDAVGFLSKVEDVQDGFSIFGLKGLL